VTPSRLSGTRPFTVFDTMDIAVTAQSSDPVPITSSPAFQEFPWQSGIVFKLGTLEKTIQKWLDDYPHHHPDIDKTVLLVRTDPLICNNVSHYSQFQRQARSLDHFDLASHFGRDSRRMEIAQTFFATRRDDFLGLHCFDLLNTADVGAAVHVLLRFQMFDQLAASIGFPSLPDRITAPRLRLEQPIAPKLSKVPFHLRSPRP
jgi:hypothetical protein